MSIGSRIKELREARCLSQTELAEKINVSKQTMYKYENDIITNIPSDKIESIAKVCNTSPEYIMGWSSDLMNLAIKKVEYDELNGLLEEYPLLKSMLLAGGKLMKTDPKYMESLVYTLQKMAEMETK